MSINIIHVREVTWFTVKTVKIHEMEQAIVQVLHDEKHMERIERKINTQKHDQEQRKKKEKNKKANYNVHVVPMQAMNSRSLAVDFELTDTQ